ncbi:MAG: TonB-dependent receptor [Rhodothalassiaceae bacterium]
MFRSCTSRRAIALALGSLMLVTGPVRSESVESEDRNRSLLEEIIVTGERSGTMTAPGLEEARRRMSRIPGSVDLVGSETFSRQYVEHLGDMLEMTPGVIAQERYSEEIRLSIRGSGVSNNNHLRGVELLLDGTPINFADGFGDFQEIDSRLTRYLEVYKGGNGFEYGAATLGGAINVVSPTGATAEAAESLVLEGGSFETARLTASLARQGEAWDFFAGASGVHSDQFRDHSVQNTGRLTMNAGFAVGDGIETRFYLIANHINQAIPGSLDLNTALTARKTARGVNVTNDWQRNIRSLRLINKTSFRVGETGQLDMGAYGTLRDLDHPIFVFIDDETTDFGIFGRYSESGDIAGLRHDLTAGFLARRSNTDDDWFVNVGGKRGFQIRSTEQKAGQLQAYIVDQVHLFEDFALDLGLQAFTTSRNFTDNFEPVNDDEISFNALNPKIGILWDVAEKAQIWANVTRSKEPPNFGALTQRPILRFVPLEAQKGWTTEIGTRGAAGAFAWDVTFFRARLKDELLQFAVDGNIPANTFNAPGITIHRGIEAGLHVTLARDLFGRAGSRLLLDNAWTFSDFYFRKDAQFGNNQIPTTLRHFYKGELRYAEEGRFHLGLALEWAPKAPYVDFANTLKATDFAVFGLRAGYVLDDGIELYVDVQNVTDKRYIATFSTTIDARLPGTNLALFTPGDGVGVFAGLKMAF